MDEGRTLRAPPGSSTVVRLDPKETHQDAITFVWHVMTLVEKGFRLTRSSVRLVRRLAAPVHIKRALLGHQESQGSSQPS